MKRKILRIINVLIAVAIITTIVFSLIVSQDEHHLEDCQEEHCLICVIIHIAQNIINFLITFVIVMIIGFLIYFFLSRLYKSEIVVVQLSLVSLKVQFNE